MQVIDPISLRQRIVMRNGAVCVAELYDLLALGPSGAMGYVLDAIDPERVIATPHESADDGRLLLLRVRDRLLPFAGLLAVSAVVLAERAGHAPR